MSTDSVVYLARIYKALCELCLSLNEIVEYSEINISPTAEGDLFYITGNGVSEIPNFVLVSDAPGSC